VPESENIMEQRACLPQQPPFLFTPQMICKLLSISRRTLRYWVKKNVLPQPLRIGPDGRVLRWHPNDVMNYLLRTRGDVGAQAALKDLPDKAGEKQPRG